MSEIIKQYYEKSSLMPELIENKMARLEQHPDIINEFEYWIQNQKYVSDGCVTEQGYTAEKLSVLSEYLDGEGAFSLLIELRETPEKALNRIKRGFKMK